MIDFPLLEAGDPARRVEDCELAVRILAQAHHGIDVKMAVGLLRDLGDRLFYRTQLSRPTWRSSWMHPRAAGQHGDEGRARLGRGNRKWAV